MVKSESSQQPAVLNFHNEKDGRLTLELQGAWVLGASRPSVGLVEQQIKAVSPGTLCFDCGALQHWNTGLLLFIDQCNCLATKYSVELEDRGLPDGVRCLMAMAKAVPEHENEGEGPIERSLFYKVGSRSIRIVDAANEVFIFIGEAITALARFAVGKARFRWADLWYTVQQCGAEALPIVALISFLVGLIMAFVGAVQLQQFGASIYVADLVGLAMVREMGVMMTPALAVDGEVKVVGKVPSVQELKTLLG